MCNEFQPQQIIDTVCKALNIEDIAAASRVPVLAHGRIIAAVLLRRHTKLSYKEIGTLLKRDASSIYGFEKRFNQLLKEGNPVFKQRFNSVWWEGRLLCA